jgi:hypothetical protein
MGPCQYEEYILPAVCMCAKYLVSEETKGKQKLASYWPEEYAAKYTIDSASVP